MRGKLIVFKFNYQLLTLALTVLSAAGSMAFKLPAKNNAEELVLRDVPMKIRPTGFYITDVSDQRSDKRSVGTVVPMPINKETAAIQQPLQLATGFGSIAGYLKHNAPVNNAYRPVNINIKKMWITESALPDGRIDGKVDLAVSFDLKIGDELSVPLTKYNTSAHYTRLANQPGVSELLLRQAFESAYSYLNNWLTKQADTNPVLAKQVKLIFNNYTESPENDTVYYSARRPLTWDDFRDKPHVSKYAAEVLPGLGYNEQTSIDKGVITVNINLKVFLPKSACWANPQDMTNTTLNHEQRHFDIVKIISERFKEKLLAQQLPVLNYDGWISTEYFETLHQMDVMQKQYDNETGHGINMAQQEKWNKYIDEQLSPRQLASGS